MFWALAPPYPLLFGVVLPKPFLRSAHYNVCAILQIKYFNIYLKTVEKTNDAWNET